MSAFLSVLAALVGFIKTLLGFVHDEKLREGGVAEQVAVQKEQASEIISTVHAAQVVAAEQSQLHPDSVLENDDGFRRD